MGNELTNHFQKMLPALEQEMRHILLADGPSLTDGSSNDGAQPDQFYGMMQYHMGWVDAGLNPVNTNSGKRIRPMLCLLACQAAGGDWQQALPAAAAIELLHNFSLIHDDIEDASPTRRGRQTVWKIWGVEQAINSGDSMFTLAHLAMSQLLERGVEAKVIVHTLRRFDETCLALTQGQHADMDFETREQVSVADYMTMITRKTAVLVSLSAELGALIAGVNPNTIQQYAKFGRDLGLAFQVIDDILGIWGDETITGKSIASDIITKKKTLPVLYGLSKNETLRQLYAQGASDDAFVTTAVALLNDSDSHSYAAKQAAAYSQSALAALEATNADGPAAKALHQLANLLLNRTY